VPIDVRSFITFALPLAAFWLYAIATRVLRYPRILAFGICWTAVELAVAVLLPSAERRWLQIALLIVVSGAVAWPDRLGLLGLTGDELEADARLRRASAWLQREHRDLSLADELTSALAPGNFSTVDGQWSVAAGLFRHSLLRRTGTAVSTTTPVTAYERAARHFWVAAHEQKLIGRRYRPSLWDEDMALRCASEEFHRLIPHEAVVERPLIPLGGWDDDAEGVIAELRSLPLRHSAANDVREALVAAMSDELALARGDRSPEALAQQKQSAERATETWSALAAEQQASLERLELRAQHARATQSDAAERHN
jgi:hypothetical protein